MRKFLVVLIALPSFVVILLLLASLLNSQFALADSLAHFRAHYIVLLLLAGAAFVILRAWRSTVTTMLAVAIGLWSTYPAWPGLGQTGLPPPGDDRSLFRLIQFNTLFKNPKPAESARWVLAQSPDFVLLQEMSSNTMAIFDQLAADLPHGIVCKFARVGGVAIRSKHPAIGSSCFEKQGFVWMQVNANGKAITLASLHTHWPYPFGQWQQLELLESDFRAMPRPIVLSGDFNAAPWSATTARIAAATDTTVVPGLRLTLRMGAGGMEPMPFLPIDHVLLPGDATAYNVTVGPPIGSDHLPVGVDFSLP